jgi:hypothetical protein
LSEVGGGGASSVAAVRRPPRVPGWLIEVARPARGPVPWGGMGLAALAIGVPVAVGLAVGHTVQGVLIAVGGLVGALADRPGPYPMRVRRIAIAGVFGGVAGLLVGTGINGRGWLVVAVLIVVAGVSALLSSISAIWSTAGLFLPRGVAAMVASSALAPHGRGLDAGAAGARLAVAPEGSRTA